MTDLTKDARGLVSGIVSYVSGDKKIEGQIPKIKKLLAKVTEDTGKNITANVTTAVALKSEEKEKLTEALSKLVQHPVVLTCTIDPSIIAGMRITIGDWIVDTTYTHQLQELAQVLGV